MATRVIALTVILDPVLHSDDARELMNAIQLLRGVATVEIVEQSSDTELAYRRAHFDIRQRLWNTFGDLGAP